MSKLFSQMSSTSLEPVPEEPLPKKKSMKGKSKKKAKPASSLSSFLNFGKQHPKQPMSKEEVKVNKKRSIENNEKFKVFLKKPKG